MFSANSNILNTPTSAGSFLLHLYIHLLALIFFCFGGVRMHIAEATTYVGMNETDKSPFRYRLCEATSFDAAALSTPETYQLDANDTQWRTIYARNCSFGAGLIITSSPTLSSEGPEAIPVVNAAVYLIDNYVSGQGLTVSAVLGTGSFIHVINMRPTFGASSPPPVSLFGSLLLGAEIAFYSSIVGNVTSSMAVSQCAKLQFLSGTTLFQLTLDANSSFTSSAALVVRGVSVTAPVNSGQAHAIHVGGVVVDSLVEVSGSTLTGDSKACLVFDSGNVSPSSPHYGRHGMGNVLNVTGNTLSVRSSVGGLPSTFVFGVVAPPAGHPALSHLRSDTLLALSANNFTAPAVGGVPSDVPLVHCHSMGALVVHDGANTGSGGRVNFITDSESPSDIVQGPQLVIRGYASVKAIAVTFRVSVTSPTILIDGCSTAALTVSSAFTIMGGNILVSGGSISSSLEIGGGAQLANKSRVAVRVSTAIPSLLFTLSRLMDSTIEIAGCTSPGLSFAFPLEEGAIVMVRDSTLTSSGLRVSTSISGGSLLHVEGNTITSTTADAVVFSSRLTLQSTAAFVGNTLVAAALSNMYAFYITSDVSSGTVVLARNIGSKGGVYITGAFYTTEAQLTMTGNTFSPSVASSTYIFYLPNWGYGARFIHDNTNKYTGARPFTFSFTNHLGQSVPQDLNVYLIVANSALGAFSFSTMTSTVRNNYQESVVGLSSTTTNTALKFDVAYAERLNFLLDDTTVSGNLDVMTANTDYVNVLVRSSTVALFNLVPTLSTNSMFSFVSSTATAGVTVGGTIRSMTSIVFNRLTIGTGRQVRIETSSSCTASATCLIAIWNTKISSTTSTHVLSFGGSIGAFTHIDIFKSYLSTNNAPDGTHSIVFDSGNPTSSASLSIVETESLAKNTLILETDCHSLMMPSTAMTGGVELFASRFMGDGIKATWSSSTMAYMHVFNNEIYQQSAGGSGTGAAGSVTSCGDTLSPLATISCGTMRPRCLMTSSFKRAQYSVATSAATPGSCIILPDTEGKLTAVTSTLSLPSLVLWGATFSFPSVVSGTLKSSVSSGVCVGLRDRLATVRSLVSRYPSWTTAESSRLFSAVTSCGGAPASSFTPALVFNESYTAPASRSPQWCKKATRELTFSLSLLKLSSMTRGMSSTVAKELTKTTEQLASMTCVPTVSLTRQKRLARTVSLERSDSRVPPRTAHHKATITKPRSASIVVTVSETISYSRRLAYGTKTLEPNLSHPISLTNSFDVIHSDTLANTRTSTRSAQKTQTIHVWTASFSTRRSRTIYPLYYPPIPAPPSGTLSEGVNAAAAGTSAIVALVSDPLTILQLDAISSVVSMAECSEGTIVSRKGHRPYDLNANPLHLFVGSAKGAADRGALLSAVLISAVTIAVLVILSYRKWQQQNHLHEKRGGGGEKVSRRITFSLFQFPSITLVPVTFVLRLLIWSATRLLVFSDNRVDICFSVVAYAAAAGYVSLMLSSTTFFFPCGFVRTVPSQCSHRLRGWQRKLEYWLGPSTSWEVCRGNNNKDESSADDFHDESEPCMSDKLQNGEISAVVWLSRYVHFIEKLRCAPWFLGAQTFYAIALRALSAAATRSTCRARVITTSIFIYSYLFSLIWFKPLTARAKMKTAIISQSVLTICATLNVINSFLEHKTVTGAVVYLSLFLSVLAVVETCLAIIRVALVRESPLIFSLLQTKLARDSSDDNFDGDGNTFEEYLIPFDDSLSLELLSETDTSVVELLQPDSENQEEQPPQTCSDCLESDRTDAEERTPPLREQARLEVPRFAITSSVASSSFGSFAHMVQLKRGVGGETDFEENQSFFLPQPSR